MDQELLQLSADRITEDYGGEVDISERELFTKSGIMIDKISYDGEKFHFLTYMGRNDYEEVEVGEEDMQYILDDFYAWF